MNRKLRSNGEFIQFLIENRKLFSPETIMNIALCNEANWSILIRDTPISGLRSVIYSFAKTRSIVF